VAVYGDHDASNSIDYLGFMYFDSGAASLCDCDNTVISGTPLIENTEVTILGSETLKVDTSDIKDTVSVDRRIKNFCGEYSFSLDTNPPGGQVETWITPATIGFYDNYAVATLAPTESYNYGTYKMIISVGLSSYPAVATDDTNFKISVLACETEFGATPQYTKDNTITYIVGFDTTLTLDLPAFTLTNTACDYDHSIKFWLTDEAGEEYDELPDFMAVDIDPKNPFNVTLHVDDWYDDQKTQMIDQTFNVSFQAVVSMPIVGKFIESEPMNITFVFVGKKDAPEYVWLADRPP
jgi:hypothetical protein